MIHGIGARVLGQKADPRPVDRGRRCGPGRRGFGQPAAGALDAMVALCLWHLRQLQAILTWLDTGNRYTPDRLRDCL